MCEILLHLLAPWYAIREEVLRTQIASLTYRGYYQAYVWNLRMGIVRDSRSETWKR